MNHILDTKQGNYSCLIFQAQKYMVWMHICTQVHNNESCTHLQNYMLVYMNTAARQNSALKIKDRVKQSIAQRGIFYELLQN